MLRFPHWLREGAVISLYGLRQSSHYELAFWVELGLSSIFLTFRLKYHKNKQQGVVNILRCGQKESRNLNDFFMRIPNRSSMSQLQAN